VVEGGASFVPGWLEGGGDLGGRGKERHRKGEEGSWTGVVVMGSGQGVRHRKKVKWPVFC